MDQFVSYEPPLYSLVSFPFFTQGARDFSSAVSGFCQVFIVTRADSPLMASANAENSRRTRE